MATLPGLRVGLTLDSATFVAETRRVNDSVNRMARNVATQNALVQRSFAAASSAVKAFAVGLASAIGVTSIGGLTRLGKQALDTAGNLDELAQQAGVTTRELQQLTVAGLQVGVEQEKLVQSLAQFGRRVGEAAQGTGSLRKVLDQYNIAVRDAEGRTRSSVSVLTDLADAVQSAGSQQEKLRIVSEAFGSRIGSRLLPLLVDGSDGFRQWAQTAEAAGLVMDDTLIAAADRASDSLATLQFAVSKGFEIGFVKAFAGEVKISEDNLRAAREAGESFGRALGTAAQFVVQQFDEINRRLETTKREWQGLADLVSNLGVTLPLSDQLRSLDIQIQRQRQMLEVANAVPGLGMFSEVEQERLNALLAERSRLLDDMARAAQRVVEPAQQTAEAFKPLEISIYKAAEATKELTAQQHRLAQAGRTIFNTSAQEERFDAQAESLEKQNKLLAEQQRIIDQRARETERQLMEPFNNFISAAQSSTASFFEEIFSGGVKSFSDLFEEAKRLVIRFAAEAAALMVFRPQLIGAFGAATGATGFAGAAGAAPSLASQIVPASAPAGIAGFREGLIGGAPAVAPTGLLGSTGFLGSNITGGQAFLAGGLGAAGGTLIGGLFGGRGAVGGGIGGGLGAAGGALIGSVVPGIGTVAGAIGGGLLGSLGGGFLGSLFGGGSSGNEATISGGLGRAGAGGTGQAAQFVRNFDQQLSKLLDTRTRAIADQALRRAGGVTVRFSGQLSANDMARLAEGRVAPVARALGFRNVAGGGRSGEEQLARLQEALGTQQQIRDLVRGAGRFTREVEDLAKQFTDARDRAREFGISTAGLADAQKRATAELKARQQLEINQLALGVIAPFEQLLAPLEAFKQQLKFADLSPAQQLAAAEQDFRRIAELSRAGSTIAIGQLQGAAELFVRLSEQVRASPGGASARAEAFGIVESVMADLKRAQAEASRGLEAEIQRASRAEIDTLKELIQVGRDTVAEIKKLRRT